MVHPSRRAGRFDATDGRGCTIPRIARLVDYGIVGEMRRFEAWRCGPPWQGGRAAAAQAVGQAAAFLRANALTEGTLSMHAVRSRGDRAVVVPSGDMPGTTRSRRSPPADLTLAACGLALANRRAVDAVAELFTHPGPWRAARGGVMGAAGRRSRNGDRESGAGRPG